MKLNVDITELLLKLDEKQVPLLKEVHFQLNEKKIYAVIGKNGSGKTTLIKTLTLLLDKRFYTIKGDIIADGVYLNKMNKEELRQFRKEKVKYVFQDAMNSFDPLRKLRYYLKRFQVDNKEAAELLKYFLMPPLDQIKNMYPWQLSGGMIQRFSIVFSLLLHPELLILDEPTSGLDAPMANLLLLKLKEFAANNKSSVLIITQDIAFSEEAADEISHIENKTLSPFLKTEDYIKSEKRIFIR